MYELPYWRYIRDDQQGSYDCAAFEAAAEEPWVVWAFYAALFVLWSSSPGSVIAWEMVRQLM